MPAGALAAARAVAVLGTAATVGRTRRLADLDGDTCAEAIGALMAERLVEDESCGSFMRWCGRPSIKTWPYRCGNAGTSAPRGCWTPRVRRRRCVLVAALNRARQLRRRLAAVPAVLSCACR
jgi:hypothetical protein